MAREAGIDAEKDTLCRYEGWLEPLKAFEALVRADEREACAKVAETYREWDDTGMGISTAIRARGE
jgi:hypothetical protein